MIGYDCITNNICPFSCFYHDAGPVHISSLKERAMCSKDGLRHRTIACHGHWLCKEKRNIRVLWNGMMELVALWSLVILVGKRDVSKERALHICTIAKTDALDMKIQTYEKRYDGRKTFMHCPCMKYLGNQNRITHARNHMN